MTRSLAVAIVAIVAFASVASGGNLELTDGRIALPLARRPRRHHGPEAFRGW